MSNQQYYGGGPPQQYPPQQYPPNNILLKPMASRNMAALSTNSKHQCHTEIHRTQMDRDQENKERVAMVASVLVSLQCARAVSAKRDAKLALIVPTAPKAAAKRPFKQTCTNSIVCDATN